MRDNADSTSSRCCLACWVRAEICDRSKAIVAPSGSCSSSALVSREADTTDSKSPVRSLRRCSVRTRSAASRSPALSMPHPDHPPQRSRQLGRSTIELCPPPGVRRIQTSTHEPRRASLRSLTTTCLVLCPFAVPIAQYLLARDPPIDPRKPNQGAVEAACSPRVWEALCCRGSVSPDLAQRFPGVGGHRDGPTRPRRIRRPGPRRRMARWRRPRPSCVGHCSGRTAALSPLRP
jgi:hypothetical protein